MAPTEPAGEHMSILERLVVAPGAGTFCRGACTVRVGDQVGQGQIIGFARSNIGLHAIVSEFTGTFMGFLAIEGERVHTGQPVAWLRV
jgi:[acyl-carrier-protein] S-malonyltransferase